MSQTDTHSPKSHSGDVPRGDFAGFTTYWKQDMLSGFLVFLIALPLCLSIALAYGYPPIAGVFTAIVGGIVTTFLSNSELTIKGPAAGLIVIAAGCVMAFGWNGVDFNEDAYRAALAVGVAAGVLQILMGVFRVGSLGEFFPSSVVHGMLAAIGVIIIAKMIPLTLGVKVGGEPLELLLAIPVIVRNLNPAIAAVGLVSLVIMFLWPLVKVKYLSAIPAAMVVVAVAIPLAAVMNLAGTQMTRISLEEEEGGGESLAAAPEKTSEPASAAAAEVSHDEKSDALVHVPAFGETFNALTFPRFEVLKQPKAWRWVFMFVVIGTLESLLSAKAVDLLDPWQRKTNLDRDVLAVGVANTLCSLIGAAPMISEIVRSRANIDNGARTRFADMWHGIFLLSFVTLLPFVIGMIPIAALMAMLVYTGYRLAHPKEFVHVFKIGPEQLAIFTATLIGCFAIDLLAGVAIGILVKVLIHLINGAPLGSFFRSDVAVEERAEDCAVLTVKQAAVFSNWLFLKNRIKNANGATNVVLDLAETRLVDHTVISNLHELQNAFEQRNCRLVITGLENHRAVSEHPHAARKRNRMHSAPTEAVS